MRLLIDPDGIAGAAVPLQACADVARAAAAKVSALDDVPAGVPSGATALAAPGVSAVWREALLRLEAATRDLASTLAGAAAAYATTEGQVGASMAAGGGGRS